MNAEMPWLPGGTQFCRVGSRTVRSSSKIQKTGGAMPSWLNYTFGVLLFLIVTLLVSSYYW
jgi:hypothetical protein